MYELIKAAENTYYIESPSKMGLFIEDGRAYLVDTGNSRDSGKKALRHIESNGCELAWILNTHAHADHTGGNAFLLARTGAKAYASAVAAHYCRCPELSTALFYGGYPPEPLRNRFLTAEACDVSDISEVALPGGTEIIPLPGHCPGMIGIKTPDGVWFLADCVSGEHVLAKYHVALIYNVTDYLATLDAIEKLSGKLFVPSHAAATEDIRPLAALNRSKVMEIAELVRNLCKGGNTAEGALSGVFAHYGLSLDFNQYALVGCTVRSYIAYLLDGGLLKADFSEGKAVFTAC